MSRPKVKESSKQLIYVKFPQLLKSGFDICGFIACRIAEDIPFKLKDVKDGMQTVATLEFDSKNKALRAVDHLKRSNIKSVTKLFCTLSINDARQNVAHEHQNVKMDIERQVEHIVQQAGGQLQKHDVKVTAADTRLKNIQVQLKNSVSLDIFELLSGEREALWDRLKELQLQKEEFQAYLKCMRAKLEQVTKSKNVENAMRELRKSFGIECCRLEKALPMYARRKDIVNTVRNNQVSIVLGETGSGKSTQLTQYLFQTGFAANGQIACTQPRKIAATSLATHVAAEMASSVGQLVGYRVGMKNKMNLDTKIVYLTDHILLNEYLRDKRLSLYSCLIIDEAHERTIFTDLLLGMIKSCLEERPDLKVIITSATIDPDIFVRYFDGCPVLMVSGRAFPVDVEWQTEAMEEKLANYEQSAVNKAIEVHTTKPEGDILVFMTSPIETERACQRFKEKMMNLHDFQCMQLHGRLQADEQQLVFEPSKKGKRKIVFATNSAETSVTIPNVKYVIDTGVVKEMRFDPKRNINSLAVTTINQSSAEQRKGRAGRTAPGICYRLYTEDDYGKMCPTSTPEILRVNLCQALLKLYELGVDPLSFNFVQAPSTEAMQTAVTSLYHIGAIDQKSITDLGKWLAKLPLPPSVGNLIWRGIQENVTIEAIAVAAACSTGGNVFYRGSTDAEKKKSDLCKIKFAHIGGDLLTLLNVYREWKDEPEKKKNKWCVDNSINSKTIRGIRDTINEILNIFKKDLVQNISHDWHDPGDADKGVQLVIFLCYAHNLCHYLGHSRAGYICLERCQRLHVHPSSAMISIANTAEWIVFEQTMKTSRDFAMTLTPVLEDHLKIAIEKGDLYLDIESARKQKILTIFSAMLGQTVFRDFVGPYFSNFRSLEAEILDECSDQIPLLEAEKELGMIKIFSIDQGSGAPEAMISDAIEKSKAKIKKWDVEQLVSKENDVRVVLGTGGQVKHVLMPGEFRSVIVNCSKENVKDTSSDDVKKHFESYGEIIDCLPLKKRFDITTWGRVRFMEPESAEKAVKDSSDSQPLWAHADMQKSHTAEQFLFKSKISWCRRSPKGFCFITLHNPEDIPRVLIYGAIDIAGSQCSVKLSKKDPNQLFIPKIASHVREEDVKNAVFRCLGADRYPAIPVFDVRIPRKIVDAATDNVQDMKRALTVKIENLIPNKNFTVTVFEPKPGNFYHNGFVAFRNGEECMNVSRALNNTTIIYEILQMTEDIFTSVSVLGFIYKVVKSDIDQLNQVWLETDPETKITVKVLRNTKVIINVHTNSVNAMTRYQAEIHKIVDGDVFEMRRRQTFNLLFLSDARKYLQDVEKETDTLIYVDSRNACVKLYGTEENRQNANDKVNEYLDKLENETSRVINLREKTGMLKALISKFGVDLADLRDTTKIVSAEVDYRKHSLKITGSNDSIESCLSILEQLESCISLDSSETKDILPDCVVCFCPIQKCDLYRLDSCGHPYCQECARRQFKSTVTNRAFPVTCCSEDCGVEWFWSDIKYIIQLGVSTLEEVTENSINAFVRENKDTYSYCTTADCPSIYRRSSDGSKFECKECKTGVCTQCDKEFHDGMNCAMFASMKTDSGLRDWCKEDPDNRKICPKCTTGIEKIGGCNNMKCTVCKGNICWVCLAYFTSDQSCYGHLSSNHGGFT